MCVFWEPSNILCFVQRSSCYVTKIPFLGSRETWTRVLISDYCPTSICLKTTEFHKVPRKHICNLHKERDGFIQKKFRGRGRDVIGARGAVHVGSCRCLHSPGAGRCRGIVFFMRSDRLGGGVGGRTAKKIIVLRNPSGLVREMLYLCNAKTSRSDGNKNRRRKQYVQAQ